MSLRSSYRTHWPRYARSVFVFVSITLLASVLSDVIADNSSIDIAPSAKNILNLLIGSIVTVTFFVWDNAQEGLKKLTVRYEELEKATEEDFADRMERLTKTLAARELAEAYDILPLMLHSEHVKSRAEALDSNQTIEGSALDVGKGILHRLRADDTWYDILRRFMIEEAACVEQGRFSLLLPTYLEIYLDLMRLFLDRAKSEGRHLEIWSFTNAIPSDWLAGDRSVAGNVMARFGKRKAELVEEMRAEGFTMKMVTMVTPSRSLQAHGFRSREEALESWQGIGAAARQDYLSKLHTREDESLMAHIQLPNLAFLDDLAEFIYLGFAPPTHSEGTEGDSFPDWKLCVSGGFSSLNRMLLARYDFLDSDTAGGPLMISIENTTGLVPAGHLGPPEELQIELFDFPRFIMSERGYGAVELDKYANLMTFPETWALASDIWHSSTEAQEIRSLLESGLADCEVVLDAAAGTGFHTRILQELGKKTVALCLSEEELEILESNLTETPELLIGDWRTLDLGREFDGIICLGSSLPYHSCWESSKEVVSESDSSDSKPSKVDLDETLKVVISNLHRCLKNEGVLVVGLARHTYRAVGSIELPFRKSINGIEYTMNWKFGYDWDSGQRHWRALIEDSGGNQWHFALTGHLFDLSDLKRLCADIFDSVEIIDIPEPHYDRYLICRK